MRKLTLAMEDLCMTVKASSAPEAWRSKLRAARSASESGVHVAIVNGRHPHAIEWALAKKIGTYFPAQKARG